jgi:hypothetical protein
VERAEGWWGGARRELRAVGEAVEKWDSGKAVGKDGWRAKAYVSKYLTYYNGSIFGPFWIELR